MTGTKEASLVALLLATTLPGLLSLPLDTQKTADPETTLAEPPKEDPSEARRRRTQVVTVDDAFSDPQQHTGMTGMASLLLERLAGFVDKMDNYDMLPHRNWPRWVHDLRMFFAQAQKTSLADALYQQMLRVNTVKHLSKNETGDVEVEVTNVQFDPIGTFLEFLFNGFHNVLDVPNLFQWWDRFTAYNAYYATTSTTSTTMHPLSVFFEDEITDKEMNSTEDRLPDNVISVQHYDPYVTGVNTLLFLFYNHILFKNFIFNSGFENLFFDAVSTIARAGDETDVKYVEGTDNKLGTGAGKGDNQTDYDYYYYDYYYDDQTAEGSTNTLTSTGRGNSDDYYDYYYDNYQSYPSPDELQPGGDGNDFYANGIDGGSKKYYDDYYNLGLRPPPPPPPSENTRRSDGETDSSSSSSSSSSAKPPPILFPATYGHGLGTAVDSIILKGTGLVVK